jgi:DNA-binding MarR family transcriptional regulator
MAGPFDAIRNFDRLVHDPSRLVILTALDACGGSEFMPLQFVTGLSRGNLSLHLGKLLANGLVSVEKKARSRRTATLVRLTPKGRRAIRGHWRRLEEVRREVAEWATIGSGRFPTAPEFNPDR